VRKNLHATPEPSGPGVIEIEFAAGARMRITGAIDLAVLTAAITALTGGKRHA
jgi:transposase